MPDMTEVLASLRSIHGGFSDREVADADLRRILEGSVRAANASNRQSYSIIVVRDAEKMQQLVGYRPGVTLFFVADLNRSVDVARHLGHEFTARGFPMLMSSIVDAFLAAQTAAVAAKALGIDSLFTNGVHRGPMERLRENLDLPEKDCFPVIALLLGYPSSEPHHKRNRVGPDAADRGAKPGPDVAATGRLLRQGDELARAPAPPTCVRRVIRAHSAVAQPRIGAQERLRAGARETPGRRMAHSDRVRERE